MICRGLDFLRSHIWKTFPFYKTTKSTTFPKGKNQPRNEKSFQYNRIWLQMMEVHSSLTATERMQQLFPCLLIPRIHAMFSLSSLCSCVSPRELAQTAKPAESIKAKEEGKGRVFSQINKLNQPMRKLWQRAQDLRVQTEDSRTKKKWDGSRTTLSHTKDNQTCWPLLFNWSYRLMRKVSIHTEEKLPEGSFQSCNEFSWSLTLSLTNLWKMLLQNMAQSISLLIHSAKAHTCLVFHHHTSKTAVSDTLREEVTVWGQQFWSHLAFRAVLTQLLRCKLRKPSAPNLFLKQ